MSYKQKHVKGWPVYSMWFSKNYMRKILVSKLPHFLNSYVPSLTINGAVVIQQAVIGFLLAGINDGTMMTSVYRLSLSIAGIFYAASSAFGACAGTQL